MDGDGEYRDAARVRGASNCEPSRAIRIRFIEGL